MTASWGSSSRIFSYRLKQNLQNHVDAIPTLLLRLRRLERIVKLALLPLLCELLGELLVGLVLFALSKDETPIGVGQRRDRRNLDESFVDVDLTLGTLQRGNQENCHKLDQIQILVVVQNESVLRIVDIH